MHRIIQFFKKHNLVHPFFFAIYPVLFLYAHNISEFREEVLVTPILVSLILTSLVFLLTHLIFRKWSIAAIVTSTFIILFFSYSRIDELRVHFQLMILGFQLSHAASINLVLGIIFVAISYITVRYQRKLKQINKVLNLFSILLVLISLFNIVYFEIKTGRILSTIQEETDTEQVTTVATKPDIYYFVFDRYGGKKTTDLYGYDNSNIYNFLESKGFYIADHATSNYPKTFLSLGSTLNMRYLDDLTEKTDGGGTSDESIVTPLVKNNRVVQFLKKQGYSYIHVGSGWDPTRSNEQANQNFVYHSGSLPFSDEFTNYLLQMTIASPILHTLFPDETAISKTPKKNEERSRTIYELSQYDQIPKIPGPKFVFMHVLLPHDPYVFDENCTPLPDDIEESRSTQENYINQVQCANKNIKKIVNQILDNSTTTPVIIIQADEGPYPNKYPIPENTAWGKASDDSLKEKFPIIAAYLFPNIEQDKLPFYKNMTSVNIFRMLFNTYFGTKYQLLPDRNIIFQDQDNFYKFTDVTERVKPVRELEATKSLF